MHSQFPGRALVPTLIFGTIGYVGNCSLAYKYDTARAGEFRLFRLICCALGASRKVNSEQSFSSAK